MRRFLAACSVGFSTAACNCILSSTMLRSSSMR